MPFLFVTVHEQNGRSTKPCMNFHVTAPSKPHVEQALTYVPPYFFATVGVEEYTLVVTGTNGVPTTVVAFPQNEMDAVVRTVTVQ